MERCDQLAIPAQANRKRKSAARRRAYRPGPLVLAIAVLALMLMISAIWRGLSGVFTPGHGPSQPAELILQNPELPNGCEVTSMAMALGAAGCPVDKLTLYGCLPRQPITERDGLRFGPDPETAYAGDATEKNGGWYCFEGPVIEAANRWLSAQGSRLEAISVTGIGQAALDGYAADGTPVVCWVTLDYAEPRRSEGYTWLLEDGTEYHPYRNLHCVVLAGKDGDSYRVADPISGVGTVERDAFWHSFSAMDSRAVVVVQGRG